MNISSLLIITGDSEKLNNKLTVKNILILEIRWILSSYCGLKLSIAARTKGTMCMKAETSSS